MVKVKCLCLSTLLLFLSGCSCFHVDKNKVVVVFSESNRIEFTGKGAGAGIALMSTMGAVGIALGVAIDEGIAKEIRESAIKAGFDMSLLVKKSIEREYPNDLVIFSKEPIDKPLPLEGTTFFVIKRYGFKTTGGEEDRTTAEIVLQVSSATIGAFEFHYPNDLNDAVNISNNEGLNSYPLSELKLNGRLSTILMDEAINDSVREIALIIEEKSL